MPRYPASDGGGATLGDANRLVYAQVTLSNEIIVTVLSGSWDEFERLINVYIFLPPPG